MHRYLIINVLSFLRILFLLILVTVAKGQELYFNCPDFNLKDYQLPNQEVIDMFFDQSGTLWIGTKNGISIFDGNKTTQISSFGVIDFSYSSIDSSLWILTNGDEGLIKVCIEECHKNNFEELSIQPFKTGSMIFPSENMRIQYNANDNILWINKPEFGYFDLNNYADTLPFKRIFPNEKLYYWNWAIDEKLNQTIIYTLKTRQGLEQNLYEFEFPNKLQEKDTIPTVRDFRCTNWVLKDSLLVFPKNTEGSIYVMNIVDNSVKNYKLKSTIFDFELLSKNELLVATWGGLKQVDLATESVKVINTSLCDKAGPASTIAVNNKNIAGGYLSNGFCISLRNSIPGFTFFNENFLCENSKVAFGSTPIYDVEFDGEGNLWIATHTGLNKLELKDSIYSKRFNGKINLNNVFSYSNATKAQTLKYDPKANALYIGYWGSVHEKIDLNQSNFNLIPLADFTAQQRFRYYSSDLSVNESGDLLFGVWSGSAYDIYSGNKLTRIGDFYDRNLKKEDITKLEFFKGSTYNSCVEYASDGKLYFGFTDKKGLLIINDVNKPLNNDNVIAYNTSNSNLPSDLISDIFEDSQKNIWIGTEKGLVKLKKNIVDESAPFKLNASLNSVAIRSIEEDSGRNLWVATNKGLKRLNKKGRCIYTIFEYMPDRILHFSERASSRYYKDSTEILAFGLSDGIILIEPNKFNLSTINGNEFKIKCTFNGELSFIDDKEIRINDLKYDELDITLESSSFIVNEDSYNVELKYHKKGELLIDSFSLGENHHIHLDFNPWKKNEKFDFKISTTGFSESLILNFPKKLKETYYYSVISLLAAITFIVCLIYLFLKPVLRIKNWQVIEDKATVRYFVRREIVDIEELKRIQDSYLDASRKKKSQLTITALIVSILILLVINFI